MTEAQQEVRRKHWESRYSLGLCRFCDSPRLPDRVRCDSCRRKHNAIERERSFTPENVIKRRQKSKEYRIAHPERSRAATKRCADKNKAKVISHYGGKCACCGETTQIFLCIDHINGGGGAQRKITGEGNPFYRWVINNNFPEGYQVLCWNCNFAKYALKICPHQLNKETHISVSSGNRLQGAAWEGYGCANDNLSSGTAV